MDGDERRAERLRSFVIGGLVGASAVIAAASTAGSVGLWGLGTATTPQSCGSERHRATAVIAAARRRRAKNAPRHAAGLAAFEDAPCHQETLEREAANPPG